DERRADEEVHAPGVERARVDVAPVLVGAEEVPPPGMLGDGARALLVRAVLRDDRCEHRAEHLKATDDPGEHEVGAQPQRAGPRAPARGGRLDRGRRELGRRAHAAARGSSRAWMRSTTRLTVTTRIPKTKVMPCTTRKSRCSTAPTSC